MRGGVRGEDPRRAAAAAIAGGGAVGERAGRGEDVVPRLSARTISRPGAKSVSRPGQSSEIERRAAGGGLEQPHAGAVAGGDHVARG